VGLSAGKSLIGGLMLGIALAILLGFTTLFFYFTRLNGPGMPAAAHAGGAGAIISLLFSPSLIVALALIFIIPAYVFVGLQIGRARATGKLVARYGQGLSQRLAEMLANRVEAMPKTHKALHKTADLLSVSAALEHLRPWVGDGRAVQFVVRTVLNRLPLADLMDEWSQTRADWGSEACKDDPALRVFLGDKIQGLLQDMSEPPWMLLWLLIGAHIVVLGLGIWMTS
jgi:hypothetical protein